MILDVHKELGHLGRYSVLFKLRERYWIPGAVSAIRHVVAKCITCRKQHARLGKQKMAALPLERVTPDNPPFFNTGMDIFGPFEIKRGRTMVKRYGLIFTCLAVRAIHLEVVHTMDTDSCLNAIRRFVARRGEVASIRTDNGTNFVGAEKELRASVSSWNQTRIESWLQQRNIEWKFNPPAEQERQKWLNPRRNLQVGDVVLIADNTSPRNSWPLARVTEVRRDAKGFVRSCVVKTKSSVIERPIAKLCLLLETEQNDVPKD